MDRISNDDLATYATWEFVAPMQRDVGRMARELIELRKQCAAVQRRYQWAANELLACDYGDNPKGDVVGWVVYGWRNQKAQFSERRRIYGASIDIAIDAELP